jgi:hypothetical protein
MFAPGESVTAHGVTVSVNERQGNSYVVTVAGSYQAPPEDFFTPVYGV